MLNHKKFIGNCSIALASALFLLQSPQAFAQETTDTATNTTSETTTDNPATAVTDIATTESTEEKDLVILHTNDIHGRLEEDKRGKVIGVAKLDTIVKEERAKDQTTLVLDAGDAFQGLPISNGTKGEDMAKVLNEIGYDAMAIGNHEFDFSLDQAKKYKEILNFPLLSANTYIDNVRVFEPSTIIDKDPNKVGDEVVVIGVTTPETTTKTHPNNVKNVEFKDPVSEVINAIKEVEAKATAENKVYTNYVVLAHLGIDETTPAEWRGNTLAEKLAAEESLRNKRIVVLDGHSHTVHTQKFGDHVIYNQTGSYLNNIGKVTLKAKGALESGVITYKDAESVVPNEKIAAMVKAAKERFDTENSVVIVENNTVELNGERSNVRVRETNLGNVVADAMYVYGQTGFANKTDLAVTNGGGLRATVKKDAPITKGDTIAVLPFGNIISQIEVKGSQIQEMFAKALSAGLQQKDGQPVLDENGLPLLEPNGAFLQISGAHVLYNPTLEVGKRILAIEIYDREAKKYVPVQADKTYYLATNDFLAAGGDGYTMLGGAREEGGSLDEVFANYLRTVKDLSAYEVLAPNQRVQATLDLEKRVVEVPNHAPVVEDKPVATQDDLTKAEIDRLNLKLINRTPENDVIAVPKGDLLNDDKPSVSELDLLKLYLEQLNNQPKLPKIIVPKLEEPKLDDSNNNQKAQPKTNAPESVKENKGVAIVKPVAPSASVSVTTSETLPEAGEYSVFNAAALAILAGLGLVAVPRRKEV